MTYSMYLNGYFYGRGDLKYIEELIVDYVFICEMYGRKHCDIRIEEDD